MSERSLYIWIAAVMAVGQIPEGLCPQFRTGKLAKPSKGIVSDTFQSLKLDNMQQTQILGSACNDRWALERSELNLSSIGLFEYPKHKTSALSTLDMTTLYTSMISLVWHYKPCCKSNKVIVVRCLRQEAPPRAMLRAMWGQMCFGEAESLNNEKVVDRLYNKDEFNILVRNFKTSFHLSGSKYAPLKKYVRLCASFPILRTTILHGTTICMTQAYV